MSENSVIQQDHMLVFRPDRSREVGLSNDLIFEARSTEGIHPPSLD